MGASCVGLKLSPQTLFLTRRLMGVPASEVGYTSATTGRGDHEVHSGLRRHLGGGQILFLALLFTVTYSGRHKDRNRAPRLLRPTLLVFVNAVTRLRLLPPLL
jgi:hypothetical protein